MEGLLSARSRPLNVTFPKSRRPRRSCVIHALERLSGKEFNAQLSETMIASHTEAIEQYSAQTHADPDRALFNFAMKRLATLRKHLGAAKSLR